MQYQIELSDGEIRAWMDHEIIRLGNWFTTFCITWHRNEQYHWAEITSETKLGSPGDMRPFGSTLRLGDIADSEGESLPSIQHEARRLWYRLRKDYPIYRDLGLH